MNKYRTKIPITFEAEQFLPPHQIPKGVMNVYQNGECFSGEIQFYMGDMSIGKRRVFDGDWLVYEDGDSSPSSIIKNDDFERNYCLYSDNEIKDWIEKKQYFTIGVAIENNGFEAYAEAVEKLKLYFDNAEDLLLEYEQFTKRRDSSKSVTKYLKSKYIGQMNMAIIHNKELKVCGSVVCLQI